MKIGLISDTHNYLDEQVFDYFKGCDEIWHAGDFGTIHIADQLRTIAPVLGVYGNIDGWDVRHDYPANQDVQREGFRVFMCHIGGHYQRYALPIRAQIEANPPDIFVCGHSHMLKIARDKALGNMIFINPGAAGRHGFQTERTIVRFQLDAGKAHSMEVIQLGPRVQPKDD